ncbi:hypothetical protein GCM10022226_78410 [Sphaerisporangium flaviroseum]|uniref:Tetratricopeptide repeat protein n=1 Tax=Sphaerisporangium flaviroseum TaxID=509199 RepID=A0ABP7JGR4_9ACTN
MLNRTDDTAMHMDRLRELLQDATDVEERAEHDLRKSWIHYLEGRHQQALEDSSRALALYQAAEDLRGTAACLNAVGYYLILYGRAQEGLKYCQDALRIQQEITDRRGQAATLDSIGLAHWHLGQQAAAMDAYSAPCGSRVSGGRDRGARGGDRAVRPPDVRYFFVLTTPTTIHPYF